MKAGGAVTRGVGLLLMAAGVLTTVVFGFSLLVPGTGSVTGGVILVGIGTVQFGGGYLLVRFGALSTGQGVGQWTRDRIRRRGLVVFEVVAGALCLVLAYGGIDVLASGRDPAEAGIPFAVIPMLVLCLVGVEMNRRGAGEGAQYLVAGAAFGSFGIVLIVFGITDEDVGRLLFGLVAALSGLASSLAARRA